MGPSLPISSRLFHHNENRYLSVTETPVKVAEPANFYPTSTFQVELISYVDLDPLDPYYGGWLDPDKKMEREGYVSGSRT